MYEFLLSLMSANKEPEKGFFAFLTTNKDPIATLLSIITTVLAIIAAIWAARKAINELRAYTRDHREKVYGEAIKQFSEVKPEAQPAAQTPTQPPAPADTNDKIISKLSALQTVTKYCTESYEQVFYLCALEADVVIYTRLRQELLLNCKKAYGFLEMINRLLWKIYLEMPKKTKRSIGGLLLTDREEKLLLNAPEDSELGAALLATFGSKKTSYDMQNISQLLYLASSLFGEAICSKHIGPFIGYSSQMLYHVNFYGKALRLTTLDRCVLRNCVSNQLKATLMTYKDSYIVDDNFSGSKFRSCQLTSARIFDSNLNRARFIRNTFENVTLRNCLLAHTAFLFNRYRGKFSIVNSCLDKTEFYHDHFKYMVLFDDTLSDVKFVGCTFKILHFTLCSATILFEKCIIDDFMFSGRSLKETIFHKCKFKNGRIVRSNLKNLQFIDCTFANPFEMHQNAETESISVMEGNTLTTIDDSPDFVPMR